MKRTRTPDRLDRIAMYLIERAARRERHGNVRIGDILRSEGILTYRREALVDYREPTGISEPKPRDRRHTKGGPYREQR